MPRVIDFFTGVLKNDREKKFKASMEGTYGSNFITAKIFYKELALQTCSSIIANALIMSEFKTFEAGKETKKNLFHQLNVEPNKNQNAIEFWNEVVTKLVYDNECLIIQVDDEFFIAEDWDKTEYIYYKNIYSNVLVNGYTMPMSYSEDDVLYFKLNNKDVKRVVDGLFEDYSTLLTAATKAYKKANGFKAILKIDGRMPQDAESKKSLEDLLQVQMKSFIESENATIPISQGMTLEESDKNKGTSKDTRDIRKLVDDIFEFVCMATKVPVGIARGDVAGTAEIIDNFLMLCINPIAKLISTELNRKLYTRNQYINRSFIKMDTQKIRLADIEKLAKTADLLFRIGVNTIDDNLELIGKERLNTEETTKRFVTKNYNALISSFQDLKGGGKNGKKNNESGN